MEIMKINKKRCITGMLQGDMIGAIHYFYNGKPRILSFNIDFDEQVGLFNDKIYLKSNPTSLFQTKINHNHYSILNKRFGKDYNKLLLNYVRIAVSGSNLKNRTITNNEKIDIIEYDVDKPKNYITDGVIISFITSNSYFIILKEKGKFVNDEIEIFDSIKNYELELI